MRWSAFWREPLVHFLALGVAIFAAHAWLAPEDRETQTLSIDRGTREMLVETFRATWLRPPTPRELDGLIENHLRETILYREALALGLDRDDVIVRRRMRQKIDLLARSAGEARDPSQAELAAWLSEHADRYRTQTRFSLVQVYLSPERRGDALDADAHELLSALRAGDRVDSAALGDATSLPSDLHDASTPELARIFGDAFAAHVASLAPGRWEGPVASGYGAHLIRITERSEGGLPALADVRSNVERDWRSHRADLALEAFYAELRERYRIIIEPPTEEAEPTPTAPVGAP